MFCPKCGNQIADNSRFCSSCGQSIAPQEKRAPEHPVYQQPVYNQPNYNQPNYNQPNYNQPNYNQNRYQPYQNQMPMNWFKFMIYFGLFAGAVLNVVSAILTFSELGEYSDLMRYYFPTHYYFAIFGSICLIGLGALQVYTRFRLAEYRVNGPQLLLVVYGVAAAITFLDCLVGTVTIGANCFEGAQIVNICTNLVMACVNKVYFDKRKHLFNR